MVVDSSALFAVLFNEQDRAEFLEAMTHAPQVRLSASTLFKCRIVSLRRLKGDWESGLSIFLRQIKAVIVPFDEAQAELAAEAYRRYGKGRDAAALNLAIASPMP